MTTISRCATALLACVLSKTGVAQPTPSPLSFLRASDGLTTLSLDAGTYNALRALNAAEFVALPLSQALTVNLDMRRFEVFAADAQVIDATGPAPVLSARPDVQLWSGHVSGQPDSWAYIALSPHGSHGYVRSGGTTYIISSGPGGAATVVYDLAGPAAAQIRLNTPQCAGAIPLPGDVAPAPQGGSYSPRTYTCRRYRLAVDCDYEFTQNLFGGNTTSSQAYATALLGAVSEIYQREMNVTLELGYLRTWGANDPYTAPDTSSELSEFQAYWNANMGSVSRNMAHMLSGRGLGGGIAYLRAACGGYGVSANINGYFPYPLQDHSYQNWDVMVVAHELGHNLGTGHTHDINSYNPIIDGCGNGDCSQAWQGTIMSYCHTCSGGMSNINLTFGPRVVTAIRSYLDSNWNCGTAFNNTSFSQQPLNQTVNIGQGVTFTTATTGPAPASYQWKKNGVALVDDGRISGAATPTLTINPTQEGDQGPYRLTAETGCGPLNSAVGNLNFTSCPYFSQQPADASLAPGDTVTFTVIAGGTWPRYYQWRHAGSPLSGGGRISGAASYSMTISGLIPEDAGAYDVVVTNGCGEATSLPATLIVGLCGSADFDCDGDIGTDSDIESFFACLGGNCPPPPCSSTADFNGDGDIGTDADIEAFFRVLGGGNC